MIIPGSLESAAALIARNWKLIGMGLLAGLLAFAWHSRGEWKREAKALEDWQSAARVAVAEAAGLDRALDPGQTLIQIGELGRTIASCNAAVQEQSASIVASAKEAQRMQDASVQAQAEARAAGQREREAAAALRVKVNHFAGAGKMIAACATPGDVMEWSGK